MTRQARSLRKKMTDVERLLWRSLRNYQCLGFHFRRQKPIGRYIVDFVCYQKNIIIEVDGGGHDQNKVHDHLRDEWLKNHGFRVLRFWNTEVLLNLQGVLQKIVQEL